MSNSKCEYCLKTAAATDLACTSCGGKIRVLEPWVLQCGWCESSNRRDLVQSCTKCGGELPEIPGSERAPNPPKTPRDITSNYRNRVMIWNNVFVIIGFVFTVFFFWTCIFALIGIPVWIYGRKKALKKLSALEFGTPTKGEITDIYVDESKRINHKHPLQLCYSFETPNGTFHGKTESWDYVNQERPIGEHIWVVYNPETPEVNNIWPPIR